ncbi:hypothetical protein SNEBB_003455 [Seison nebaliae]|nr:hypothetical protein SNEBB_003455 [Seison nebaliae]
MLQFLLNLHYCRPAQSIIGQLFNKLDCLPVDRFLLLYWRLLQTRLLIVTVSVMIFVPLILYWYDARYFFKIVEKSYTFLHTFYHQTLKILISQEDVIEKSEDMCRNKIHISNKGDGDQICGKELYANSYRDKGVELNFSFAESHDYETPSERIEENTCQFTEDINNNNNNNNCSLSLPTNNKFDDMVKNLSRLDQSEGKVKQSTEKAPIWETSSELEQAEIISLNNRPHQIYLSDLSNFEENIGNGIEAHTNKKVESDEDIECMKCGKSKKKLIKRGYFIMRTPCNHFVCTRCQFLHLGKTDNCAVCGIQIPPVTMEMSPVH